MACQTDGTQTLDTGHQIAASNVSFDDERIDSGCPHVQCALDLVYETQQQHLADFENPHEVNIGQIPHILSDHTDVSAVAPLDGQVLTSQGGVYVPSNPVTGVTDHLLLSNIGTNTHDVIDAHLADLSQNPHMITPAMIGAEPENANIQAHIADTATNPHQVTYEQLGGTAPLTGFKNALINPRMMINQRGFDGNWDGLLDGEFGFDRWYKSGTDIKQKIEDANLFLGDIYTLSIDGVFHSSFAVLTGTVITVPNTATYIQLERGLVQTNFEVRNIQQELAMCQRFYWRARSANGASKSATSLDRAHYIKYPVTMARVPDVSDNQWTAGTEAVAYVTEDGAATRTAMTNTDAPADFVGATFEAEIT